MAITEGTATLQVSIEERTWRVNIETPKGLDPTVTVFREKVTTDTQGNVIAQEQVAITYRALSTILTETQDFTPSQAGKLTGVELAQLIADRADIWRKQDTKTP